MVGKSKQGNTCFSLQVPGSATRHLGPFQDLALDGGGVAGAMPPMLAV